MAEKQFAIIGLGRFGYSLARELSKADYEVFAIDKNLDLIEDIEAEVTHAAQADPSDPADFAELGLGNFDAIVIAIGEDLQASILICMQAKEAGVPFILAKASSKVHGKILKQLGADQIVYPEEEMGCRVAHRLMKPNVLEHFEFSDHFALSNMRVPRHWVGKTIGHLNVRAKYGINIVAVRLGGDMIISPPPTRPFTEEDILVMIGGTGEMHKIENRFGHED